MEKGLLPDIERLNKICSELQHLEEYYYHMDDNEYGRMKKYVYDRFGISLPLNNPTNTTE